MSPLILQSRGNLQRINYNTDRRRPPNGAYDRIRHLLKKLRALSHRNFRCIIPLLELFEQRIHGSQYYNLSPHDFKSI